MPNTQMHRAVAIGDSQTVPGTSYGVMPRDCWVAQTQRSINARRRRNRRVRFHAIATGGHDTGNMLNRISDAFQTGLQPAKPTAAAWAGGVNDPGVYTQAQTQANTQAGIKALMHRAIGDGAQACAPVATVSLLPANGTLGQRRVVMVDDAIDGGVAAFDPLHHSTIATNLSGAPQQTVWEFRRNLAGRAGWGRVRLTGGAPLLDVDGRPLGIRRIVVVSPNYLNFPSGGDTPSVDYAPYALIRAALQAAVAAETTMVGGHPTVTYADMHALEKADIVAGRRPNFSADTSIVPTVAYTQSLSSTWVSGNQHFSADGHGYRAFAVRPQLEAHIEAEEAMAA